MTIIKQKTQNINSDTVRRINKISKSFKSAKRGSRARMLQVLASEIDQTQNKAVRNWLVRFHSTLQTIGGAK